MTLVGKQLFQSWVMVFWHHCMIYSYGYPIVFLVIYSLLYKNINLPKPLELGLDSLGLEKKPEALQNESNL